MSRLLPAALAAFILLVPATASGSSTAQIRGTVAAKLPANGLVTVESRRATHILRVPGSQARIRLGQRVELRGRTLRERGNGSRVLARNVSVARSVPRSHSRPGGTLVPRDDDELEVKGTLTSLSPLTVTVNGHSASCAVPAGHSLAGFAVGDFVEMTCDLIGGVWVLRELEHEDDEDDADDENRGPGNADDEDEDNSGPGSGDDDDDNSGPGNGGEDDDDDGGGSSGPGGADD